MQPRLPLQETPPRQDQRTLALHRNADDHYLWHGPYGATYLVTDHGTQRA
jgi:hypothetical protein